MEQYSGFTFTIDNQIGSITFNRPEKLNAFANDLIMDLSELLEFIKNNPQIRVLLIRSEGKHFCVGADLKWMKKMAYASIEDNEVDARLLAKMLFTLNAFPKPTIALVQGRAMGGGIGFLACCDIVLVDKEATFAFSEVKLGLIPATIGPYVVRKIGISAARRYFLTGESFNAEEAKRINLIHEVCPSNKLNETGDDIITTLLQNPPNAVAYAKQYIQELHPIDLNIIKSSSSILANIRTTDEAKEGIQAFLDKRKPHWAKT